MPGTYECVGATLQYCNGGTWQTQATCSANTPKCDANQQKCVPYAIGDNCTSTSQCGANFCSWGVCCSQNCDLHCTSSCSGGSCQPSNEGSLCNKRTFNAVGFNDIDFVCHSGSCLAPKIICNDTEGCDLTNNVCCVDDTSSSIFQCTSAAACANSPMQEWFSCGSSADCPKGLVCLLYFQDVGARYTECVPASDLGTSNWMYESCDPNVPGTCVIDGGGVCNACTGCGWPGTCP
jgi:hypothetical protein